MQAWRKHRECLSISPTETEDFIVQLSIQLKLTTATEGLS